MILVMTPRQKAEMFAATPFWLWPVLWWSLGRYEVWLARFQAEHGPRELILTVTTFGTIRVLHIGDPHDKEDGLPRVSTASLLAFAHAVRPQRVISQPVRTAACAFARRANARAGASGAWGEARRERPASLAPG